MVSDAVEYADAVQVVWICNQGWKLVGNWLECLDQDSVSGAVG